MQEIELKLELDETQERRLRNSARLKALSMGPAKTQSVWSIYYDTPQHDLRAHGIALRLRRVGGEWIQTLKRMVAPMQSGLSTPIEIEYPVASRQIDLTRIPEHDLREQLIGIARSGLEPVAETRFKRTKRILALPDGSVRAEFALDKGELGLGDNTRSFIEAEFELREGSAAALYALASEVLPGGPVRFATASKSERALAVLQGDTSAPLRKARPVDLGTARTVEEAAIAILGEGLAHTAPNIALVLDSDDTNGPHQMRVGLRRLRSALAAFRSVLGREALAGVSETARTLASEAGRIRDLDVLTEDIISPVADKDGAEQGYQCLLDAIRDRRAIVRADVQAVLANPEHALFSLHLAGFIANRTWVDGADHRQTARLAQPLYPFACRILDKRWKALRQFGDRIRDLSIDERHEMRKETKKLRYLVDAFRSLLDPQDVSVFTRRVKRLQKAFGALNDAAMAEMILMAPDAPCADDPIAQRAAGRIIGRLHAESDALWPAAIRDWRELEALGGFWRSRPDDESCRAFPD